MKYFSIFFLLVSLWGNIESSEKAHWSYEGSTGPKSWCDNAKSCCGEHQSPIDLIKSKVTEVKKLNALNFEKKPKTMTIENNGHSVGFTVGESKDRLTMSGGGLGDSYIFDNLHFHWGDTSRQGSEHTIGGKSFSIEAHLVTYRAKYGNLSHAVASNEPRALAVFAVLFQEQSSVDSKTKSFSKAISDAVSQLKYIGKKTEFLFKQFPIKEILPGQMDYFYRYEGSLTTPPCNEIVVWTVFDSIGAITKEQMQSFRNLRSTLKSDPKEKSLVNNFRPVQKINDRKVTYNCAAGAGKCKN